MRATLLAVILASAGCTAVRLSQIDSASFAPSGEEERVWREADDLDKQLGQSGALFADDELRAYCESVGQKLLPHLTTAAPGLRIYVLSSPFLNAFALPNGTVYLHTGILASMANEAQLATVLAHELTHYVERHAIEQQETAKKRRQAGEIAASILAVTLAGLAGRPDAVTDMMAAMSSATQSLVTLQVLGYSRELEAEADARGFDAIVAAGYDARQSTAIFDYLTEDLDETGVQEPYFFGSHPRLEERIANYRERLVDRERRGAVDSNPVVGEAEFMGRIAKTVRYNALLDVAIGKGQRAVRALERQIAYDDGVAETHFVLAEVYRRSSKDRDQYPEAAASYRRAIELDPKFALAHRELGLIYRANGERADAVRELRRYIELAGDDYDTRIIEGYVTELASTASGEPGVVRRQQP